MATTMAELSDLIAGSQGSAESINAALAAGEVIVDSHGIDVTLHSPIRPVSGMKFLLRPDTIVRRGWRSRSDDENALLARANSLSDTNDFLIDGGQWCGSPDFPGRIFCIYGNNWEIRNAQIQEFHGSQGIVFAGDNVRLSNVRAVTSDTRAGTGAFRMIGGKGFRGTGLYGVSGDDVFQFVPITSATHPRFNMSIEDSYYEDCRGKSTSARLMIAAIGGPQNENRMTATIRNCGWIRCTGGGGNRSLVIEVSEGDGSVPRQIDGIVVRNCAIDGASENHRTVQSVLILGSFPQAVGDVTISDTAFTRTARAFGMTVNSPGANITLNNVRAEGQQNALSIRKAASVHIRGGEFSSARGDVIHVQSTAESTDLTVRDAKISGVATSKAGVRISSATARTLVDNVNVRKADGAKGTSGVRHIRGSEVWVGKMSGDVDNGQSGGGMVMRQNKGGSRRA